MKILFATSEVYPLIKTGGLADVSSGLPAALHALGEDVRVVIPAYRDALSAVGAVEELARFAVSGCGVTRTVTVLSAVEKPFDAEVLLLAVDDLFNRSGNPYQNSDGEDLWDNGERFGLFSRAVVEIAMDRAGLRWQPDVVHSHDWQTGLVPAFLSLETPRPRTVFTIHNLSYPGRFPYALFAGLGLPADWWHYTKLEFYNSLSMIKGGIVFADQVTTVSPSYADEICLPEHGLGLDGALQQCRDEQRLSGIINGMDTQVWNPATDEHIPYRYSVKKGRVAQKKRNKQALLTQMAGPHGEAVLDAPLCGFVGRLVEQKGIDLIVDAVPDLLENSDACFVFIGSGQAQYETLLRGLAERHPQRVFVYIGYSEAMAHLLEAGCDLFLMPSRFEPCGLNQMYSLTYGTPPLVHATGGLKDTVVNATADSIKQGDGTGFVFNVPSSDALRDTLLQALALYRRLRSWQQLQKNGMLKDFSWQSSAERYLELYRSGEV
ncbi:glycogen synthase GlgA [uncultured Desulfuromonas sp.]|uniref:glycogen synthase GlgA n=1 Tax=uncultured Desulfuromonas sp. TaxID=181013 RepID=UPI002AAADDAF|nr:glycogen synthase GlgA [uncultured Desulfuromonas sp.]